MNYFLLFLFASFVGGMLLRHQSRQRRFAYLLLLCLALSFGYFFLNKI